MCKSYRFCFFLLWNKSYTLNGQIDSNTLNSRNTRIAVAGFKTWNYGRKVLGIIGIYYEFISYLFYSHDDKVKCIKLFCKAFLQEIFL